MNPKQLWVLQVLAGAIEFARAATDKVPRTKKPHVKQKSNKQQHPIDFSLSSMLHEPIVPRSNRIQEPIKTCHLIDT